MAAPEARNERVAPRHNHPNIAPRVSMRSTRGYAGGDAKAGLV